MNSQLPQGIKEQKTQIGHYEQIVNPNEKQKANANKMSYKMEPMHFCFCFWHHPGICHAYFGSSHDMFPIENTFLYYWEEVNHPE